MVFNKQKHMLGDDYSMLDVALAPLLWRLSHYEIELPNGRAGAQVRRAPVQPSGFHRRADAGRARHAPLKASRRQQRATMSEQSAKPYLVRALYEWCVEQGYTPIWRFE